MRVPLALLVTLFLAATAQAIEIADVQIEPSITVNGHVLKLNGSGIRKKFFVKVYIGSLYSSHPLSSAPQALSDSADKLIRMNFLYSKIEKEKITEAFKEGFAKNSPELLGSVEARKFLSLFTDDFKRGDVVDLFLGGNGSVTVKHNGKELGMVASSRLATGVLAIFLGEKPADEGLKKGMLMHMDKVP